MSKKDKQYKHIQDKISDSLFNVSVTNYSETRTHKVKIGDTKLSIERSLIRISPFSMITDISSFVSEIIFKKYIPKEYLHR